jgi:ArsR family transcriptional regulator, arsenate/arsenite/antimonite-responsive transcriptional repressor
MKSEKVAELLGCLGQPTRLEILKLLAPLSKNGETAGLPAGRIATLLNIASPTLSFHLKDMTLRNLLSQKRMGREVLYLANLPVILGALGDLVEQLER